MASKEVEIEERIVVPGEFIANAKTITPGKGTYVQDDRIYSLYLGHLRFDAEKSVVYVEPFKKIIYPKRGDLVLAEVISSGNTIASLKIWFLIRSISNKEILFSPLNKPFSGTIHISQLGTRTESINKLIKTGDKVLGVITTDYTLPLSISIASKELGVVAANCSRCGAPLIKKGRLFCPICNKPDIRKTSSLYNYEKFNGIFRIYKPKQYITMEVE